MASIFGINPVKGGSPANESRRIEIENCVTNLSCGNFPRCLEDLEFIELRIINNGIINLQ